MIYPYTHDWLPFYLESDSKYTVKMVMHKVANETQDIF